MTYPDREIIMTRKFHAPRQSVFNAFTKPDLVRRWLLGPPGWTMPVCEINPEVGGKYRYVWRKDGVEDMGVSGEFREVEAPGRLAATEKFDDPWYPGEAFIATTFVEAGGITTITTTIRYETQEARDTVQRSGMEHGMKAGYDRLEQLLLSSPATITTPEITETEPRIAAIIHLTSRRDQMRNIMAAAIDEISRTLAAQSLAPAGPLFAYHLTTSADTFDFKVGFPVPPPVEPSVRVRPGELPGRPNRVHCLSWKIRRSLRRMARVRPMDEARGPHRPRRLLGDLRCRTGGEPRSNNWRTELCLPLEVSRR